MHSTSVEVSAPARAEILGTGTGFTERSVPFCHGGGRAVDCEGHCYCVGAVWFCGISRWSNVLQFITTGAKRFRYGFLGSVMYSVNKPLAARSLFWINEALFY